MNKNKQIAELIHRRREQMLVHSYIYYQLNDNIIDDSTWSKWAMELQQLQKDYPEKVKECMTFSGRQRKYKCFYCNDCFFGLKPIIYRF